jgi:uncharacterized membrane protein
MSKVEAFLTKAEEQEIVDAIVFAEKNTSGEIRVHLEKETSKSIFERALEVFQDLKMYETKDKNGVLIYIAVKSKSFYIYGDEGINNKVGLDFWNSTKDIMVEHFKNGKNKQAIVEGILEIGNKLKLHFPYQNDDTNELSNEISKG